MVATIEQAAPSGVVGAGEGDISQLSSTQLLEAAQACKQGYLDRLTALIAAHKEAVARDTDELHQLESELQAIPQLIEEAVLRRDRAAVVTLKEKFDYLPLDIGWKKEVITSAEQELANKQLVLATELRAAVLPYTRRIEGLLADAEAANRAAAVVRDYAGMRYSTALQQAKTDVPKKIAAAKKESADAGSDLVRRYKPGPAPVRDSLRVSGS